MLLEANKRKGTIMHYEGSEIWRNGHGTNIQNKSIFYKGMHIICACFALILCLISFLQNWDLTTAIMAFMSAFIAELMTLFMRTEAKIKKVKEKIKIYETEKRIVSIASKEIDYLMGLLS